MKRIQASIFFASTLVAATYGMKKKNKVKSGKKLTCSDAARLECLRMNNCNKILGCATDNVPPPPMTAPITTRTSSTESPTCSPTETSPDFGIGPQGQTCLGTVISSNCVLTAASCFYDLNGVYDPLVYVEVEDVPLPTLSPSPTFSPSGGVGRRELGEGAPEPFWKSVANNLVATEVVTRVTLSDETKNGDNIFIHPDFVFVAGFGFAVDDFAVICFDEALNATAVKLNDDPSVPELDSDLEVTLVPLVSVVSEEPVFGNELEEESAVLISNQVCASGGENYWLEGRINPTMMCTVSDNPPGNVPCGISRGGPAITADSGVQVGITSWSAGLCDENRPVVFARVSSAIDFIRGAVCALTSEGLDGEPCQGDSARSKSGKSAGTKAGKSQSSARSKSGKSAGTKAGKSKSSARSKSGKSAGTKPMTRGIHLDQYERVFGAYFGQ